MSVTTKTLSPNGSSTNTVTMPGYDEAADIQVINTDLSNITDAINNNYTNKAPNMNNLAFNGDIDTLRTPGRYYINGGSSTIASLSGLYGTLLVMGNSAGDGNRVTQFYIPLFGGKTWFRRYGSNGWDAELRNIAEDTVATQSANGLMSATDKTKLDGVATNANNYSLPLSANGTRGGIQIGYSENNKNYAVKLSSEKAYVTVPWENTTYSNATTSAAGLMSSSDKTKLNGIAENANNYSLPLAASGTRGGVQTGYTENLRNYALKLSSEKGYVTVPEIIDTGFTGDIDTLLTAGRYYLAGASCTTSGHTNMYGTLLVIANANGSGTRVTQLCIKTTGGGPDIWARYYTNSWGAIQIIARQDDIYNDLDKTASGFALDARQGKALGDRFVALGTITASDLPTFLASVCSSFASKTSETAISLPVKATWSGNDYWTGTMTRSGTNGRYITFILAANANRIVIGYYDTSTSALTSYRPVGCGMYKNLDELGLSGTPTILQIFNAMPTGSIATIESGVIATSDQPMGSGAVSIVIVKTGNSARSFIHAVSKNGAYEWIMGLYGTTYNGNDANKPSGVWRRQLTTEIISVPSGGSTTTYTFPEATSFVLMIYRTGTTQTGAFGFYFGFAGTGNSVLMPVMEPSAGATVSISNLVLSFTASAANVYARVIY